MSSFLEALDSGPLLSDGAMGSYIFARTGRLSEMNHVYEALSADNPDLVRGVHLAYLQAGARCLTTNSFEANRPHLQRFGQANRVAELNRAAVQRAREAIEQFGQQRQSGHPLLVVGSIGPTPEGDEPVDEARDIYREQMTALLAEGVDALQIETFRTLNHVEVILDIAAEVDNCPPLIVQMALERLDSGDKWSFDPLAWVETGPPRWRHLGAGGVIGGARTRRRGGEARQRRILPQDRRR